jgi:hypothetical protein
MMRRSPRARQLLSGASTAAVASLLFASSAFAIPAFPGADGFGANAAGGRGGDVYHVTTLADDPNHLIPGSLFYGLYDHNVPAAGRTIVFDVGGTIYLNQGSTLDIKNIHNVTIAGQTAPGGITIVGNTVQITGSSGKETRDIIVRYLTVRKGAGDGEDNISIKGAGSTHDIILDHVSTSWSEDESISVTQNATRVTVQNSIISEALNPAGHAYGSLIRPDQNSQVSYIRNLYSNNKSRNPRPGTYDNFTLDFDFRNNVIYNWSDRAGYTGGASEPETEHVNMNYIGNYAIAGPATPASARNTAFTKDASNDPLDLHVYQSGNLIDATAGTARDGADTGWGMFINWNGTTSSPFPDADKVSSPFAYPMASTDAADVAYAKVVASAGAFPYARSAVDQRLIGNVVNYTGAVVNAPNATEWNNILSAPMQTRPAGFDTDRDGMPNAWETARGLNPNVADNNAVSSTGYTNLENYLNELTLIATWNLDADGNWSQIVNWAGDLPQAVGATANFNPGITAPRTVSVDLPVTLSQLNFDSTVGYTLGGGGSGGGGTITMDAISGTTAIGVASGSHTIAAPLVLARNTNLTVLSGSSITFAGPLTATGVNIVKDGGGAATVPNLRAAGVTINAGTVTVAPNGTNAGASRIASLNIGTGATLDLNDNSMLVGPATAQATLQAQIVNARHGGAWDQNGITSSAARTQVNHATTLGLLSGAEYTSVGGTGTFAGQSYASDDSLIKYTWYGDSDFNGRVNFDDYVRIDNGFNNHLSGWLNGDFDLNGTINFDDYVLIDLAFNTQTGTLGRALSFLDGSDRSAHGMSDAALRRVQQHFEQFGEAYARGLLAAVPEPTALVFAGVVTLAAMSARRRSRFSCVKDVCQHG